VIQTIRLAHVLREAVTTPYRNLVTRPTGAAVRGRIERAMVESGCGTALLDFSDVELLDLSCADEIVAKLLLVSASASDRYVVLWGLREDQVEAIDHVLTHQRLAVAALAADTEALAVLGAIDPDGRIAFNCVAERGPMRAPAVADALTWEESRARCALEMLAALRLVRVRDDAFRSLLVA
jgi:hypothetical protein